MEAVKGWWFPGFSLPSRALAPHNHRISASPLLGPCFIHFHWRCLLLLPKTKSKSSHPREWLLQLGPMAKCLQIHWSQSWWNPKRNPPETRSSALPPESWDPTQSSDFSYIRIHSLTSWDPLPREWRTDFVLTSFPRVLQVPITVLPEWLWRFGEDRIPRHLLWHHRIPGVPKQLNWG